MRKLILCLVIMASAAGSLRAKQPPLASAHIAHVYIYAKLVRQDDATAAREVSWLREVVVDGLGWQIAPQRSKADAIIIVVPHGAGYQTGGSDSCSSIAGSLTCNSSDGSSLSVTCIEEACDSDYNPGNYLSLIVATPVAGDTKQVRMLWRSDRGFGGFAVHMNVGLGDSVDTQDVAFQAAVAFLCRAAGIGGRRKCSSLTWKSWKQWVKSSNKGADTISLP